MKTKIIVVAGPTASGKTSLAVELALCVGGEIICADSMQVYKNMKIATAAPTKEEKEKVPHHLCEFLNEDEEFSVARFTELAKIKIKEIVSRGKVPIIVGGTGLFIDSLVDNIKFTQAKTDFELRQRFLKEDAHTLYEKLKEIDEKGAENIHENNKMRVVRALELYYTSGVTKTKQNENSKLEKSPYETLYFVLLYNEREKLYNRINQRVDNMINDGLIDEAMAMRKKSQKTSKQAIGHKELYPYFDNKISLDEAVENLKRETRRYAKRQITWFKKRENTTILIPDSMNENELYALAINKSKDFLNG